MERFTRFRTGSHGEETQSDALINEYHEAVHTVRSVWTDRRTSPEERQAANRRQRAAFDALSAALKKGGLT